VPLLVLGVASCKYKTKKASIGNALMQLLSLTHAFEISSPSKAGELMLCMEGCLLCHLRNLRGVASVEKEARHWPADLQDAKS